MAGWDLADFAEISFTASGHRRALPEIYVPDDEEDWHHVQGSWDNDHHGNKHYYFGGVTTAKAWSTSAEWPPRTAWRHLNRKSDRRVRPELISIQNGGD